MIKSIILAMSAAIGNLGDAPLAEPTICEEKTMFNEASIDQLNFLEGRWSGSAPDGSTFYEAYDRPDPLTLRSRRYKDATFTDVTDGSTVTLKDGQVNSTWGEYVWQASCIKDGYASFEPVNAPSSFSWKRVEPNIVEVTQKWTDDKGQPQSYSLQLERVH